MVGKVVACALIYAARLVNKPSPFEVWLGLFFLICGCAGVIVAVSTLCKLWFPPENKEDKEQDDEATPD